MPQGSNPTAADFRDTPTQMLAWIGHLVGSAGLLLAFPGQGPQNSGRRPLCVIRTPKLSAVARSLPTSQSAV